MPIPRSFLPHKPNTQAHKTFKAFIQSSFAHSHTHNQQALSKEVLWRARGQIPLAANCLLPAASPKQPSPSPPPSSPSGPSSYY